MTEVTNDKPRLIYVTTHAQSARLLLAGQMAFMRSQGFEVILICSPDKVLNEVASREGVTIYPVQMKRELSPLSDLVALWQIFRLLVRLRPQIVNAGTPKAGLLGMIAAIFAQVPIRIYTLRGLRLETTSGWKRRLLQLTERISSACSQQVVCNSESLRQLYVKLGLAKNSKTTVLGGGSGNGVDGTRFHFSQSQFKQSRGIRKNLGIPDNSRVIGFVGRLTKDKGIVELVEAFEAIAQERNSVHLLLVGGFESGDAVPEDTIEAIRKNPCITTTGFLKEVTLYYPILDLVVLPSYREGFPNVALEAAASALPVVGYQATGTVDAVKNGVTGRLVPIGCIEALANVMREVIFDSDLARRFGEAGRARVQQKFLRETVWKAWLDCYQYHLEKQGYQLACVDALQQRQAA